MWKNSKKLKYVKIKFPDQYTIKEMNEDLNILNQLEVVDYKITGSNNFSIAFNNKFIDYYNLHHDRLQASSLQNMLGALEENPKHGRPTPGEFVTMFYSTVLLSYLNETGLIQNVDTKNLQLLARLVVTIEDLRNMMVEQPS